MAKPNETAANRRLCDDPRCERVFRRGFLRGIKYIRPHYLDEHPAVNGKVTRVEPSVAEGKVTRIELIDHRRDAALVGRLYTAWGVAVTLSYQDNGRTLKVFVDDPAT